MRDRVSLAIALLIGLVFFASVAVQGADGQSPRTLPYQGRLELGGTPITGTADLSFTLFDSPDPGTQTSLWTGSFDDVQVRDGAFAVLLGSSPSPFPSDLFAEASLYLAIAVDGQPLAGFQQLQGTAHAVKAQEAYDFTVTGTLEVGGTASAARLGAGTVAPEMSIEAQSLAQYDSPAVGGRNGANWLYMHVGATDHSLIWNQGAALRFGVESALGNGYVERGRLDSAGNLQIDGAIDIGLQRVVCENVASGSQCSCPVGKRLLGGGAYCAGGNQHVNTSYPVDDDSWQAWCEESDGTNVNVRMAILCARL